MSDERRFRDPAELAGTPSPAEVRFERVRRTVGLFLGPSAFTLLMLDPVPLADPAASRLAAVVAWVLIWWITEAVPIPATAVLGPCLAVVVGAGEVKEMFAPFGDPIIFLFLGSFLLAEAMAVHRLDRRIAYSILAVRAVSASPARIFAAFAVLAAGLSMWLSNSATTAMLYPIALGVLGACSRDDSEAGPAAPVPAAALLLTCAYASSIGGIGSPVGSPPNLIALGQISLLAGVEITFFEWMMITTPILLAVLGAMALSLRAASARGGAGLRVAREFIDGERRQQGRLGPGERNVLAAFSLAVTLWVLPGVVALVAGPDSPAYRALRDHLPEGVVACCAGLLLFVLPTDWRQRRFTLSWGDASRIDWGTLLLFGGGLSLGAAMFRTGLAGAVGAGLTELTGADSRVALTVLFTVFAIYFTEVTSNTATATMLVPLAIAAAQAAGVSAVEPALGCALGCSMAFMLPVATPPNAIVYGSGLLRITQMIRAGFWLNLCAAVLIPIGVLVLVPLVLG